MSMPFHNLTANNVTPDQTAPEAAVWSGFTLFAIPERASFRLYSSFKRDNSKGQQGRSSILAHNTPSWPDIHAYQILSKLSQRVLKLLSAQTFVYRWTWGWSLPPNLVGQGIKRGIFRQINCWTIFRSTGNHFLAKKGNNWKYTDDRVMALALCILSLMLLCMEIF